uniref:Metal tolerance protein 2 isoform X1 n=1 Tax=Rhizophora mucronata TaxID=61149 RepID=A0A2P2K1K6_RHIMU
MTTANEGGNSLLSLWLFPLLGGIYKEKPTNHSNTATTLKKRSDLETRGNKENKQWGSDITIRVPYTSPIFCPESLRVIKLANYAASYRNRSILGRPPLCMIIPITVESLEDGISAILPTATSIIRNPLGRTVSTSSAWASPPTFSWLRERL